MREEFVDRRVSEVAARQYGVVTKRQLLALGISKSAIGRRSTQSRLHRMHHGVYAVGHPVVSRHGHWLAAVLACGPGAALSHASAAALWELRASSATLIDVSVRSAGGRSRQGLRIHRRSALEATTKDGIGVTTPAQTVLDLAATLPQRALERAIDQAEIQHLDLSSLDALISAHPRRPGATRLRRALEEPATLTRSELEEQMLAICRAHDLPAPRTNATVDRLEVDFLFPDARLVVETDGWTYHRTRHAFERERQRHAQLARAGLRVLRFSERQLRSPAAVAATVRAALRSSG